MKRACQEMKHLQTVNDGGRNLLVFSLKNNRPFTGIHSTDNFPALMIPRRPTQPESLLRKSKIRDIKMRCFNSDAENVQKINSEQNVHLRFSCVDFC